MNAADSATEYTRNLDQCLREAVESAEARAAVVRSAIVVGISRADVRREMFELLSHLESEGAPPEAFESRLLSLQSDRGVAIETLHRAEAMPHTDQLEWYIGEALKHQAKLLAGADLADAATFACNGGEPAEVIERIDKIKIHLSRVGTTAPRRLMPVRLADYDPSAKVPVLFGDPDGDVLMADGDMTEAIGEVGTGKTLSIQDAGLAAAFNQPFLGFAPSGERRVMLVLADGDGERPTQRRLYRLAAGRNLSPHDVDTCGRFRLFVPDAFNLDAPADFAELLRELAEFDPDLLGIESITSLMGADRNGWNQGAVADFMATRLRPLQSRPDGTRRGLLVGTHLTKRKDTPGGGRAKDRVSASFYVLGGCDAAISLEGAGDESFKVRPLKRSRWGCCFAPFLVTIAGQQGEPLRLENHGTLQASTAERSKADTDLLAAIAALDGPGGFVRLADAKARLGAKRGTTEVRNLERAAKRLIERGELEAGPKGKGLVRIPTPTPEAE